MHCKRISHIMIFIQIVNVISVFAISGELAYSDDDSNMITGENILNDTVDTSTVNTSTVHSSTTITTTKYILISSVEDHRCK